MATLTTLTAQVQATVGDLPLVAGYNAGEDFQLDNITRALNWACVQAAKKGPVKWTQATHSVPVLAGASTISLPFLRVVKVATE